MDNHFQQMTSLQTESTKCVDQLKSQHSCLRLNDCFLLEFWVWTYLEYTESPKVLKSTCIVRLLGNLQRVNLTELRLESIFLTHVVLPFCQRRKDKERKTQRLNVSIDSPLHIQKFMSELITWCWMLTLWLKIWSMFHFLVTCQHVNVALQLELPWGSKSGLT